MKVTGAAAIIFLMLPVCSCTTTVGKERAAELQKPRPEILLKGRMPSLRSPHDLGGLLAYMRDGSEEERRRGFIALQTNIDWCLSYLIEYLGDAEPFGGVTFPIMNRSGTRISSVEIPPKGFTTGAAIERFFIGYFYKDPARRTFHPRKREGAVEAWRKWYENRRDSLRWNSWGMYSNK